MSAQDTLARLGACRPARRWAAQTPLYALWRTCHRGDWMLWLAGRVGVDRKLLVTAACACVRTALVHVPDGEERPRIAIETAEAWTRGEATPEEVRHAADEAAVVGSDAAYASYIAAAVVERSAAAAAAALASLATRGASEQDAARIVRHIIPWRVVRDELRRAS